MATGYKPVEVTDANFAQEVGAFEGVSIVDFWAAWCGPCRMQGPIIDQLAADLADSGVKVAKLNVDENPDSAQKFGVMSIPTLIIFKAGKAVDKLVGVTPLAALKARIQRAQA
ncbi:MAG: Thioredoxin [Firmicutes bacterium ADurb.Bin506]|nr:MAG: Thioredoxin [Firmicutes bacterium ADurb.Bin506]